MSRTAGCGQCLGGAQGGKGEKVWHQEGEHKQLKVTSRTSGCGKCLWGARSKGEQVGRRHGSMDGAADESSTRLSAGWEWTGPRCTAVFDALVSHWFRWRLRSDLHQTCRAAVCQTQVCSWCNRTCKRTRTPYRTTEACCYTLSLAPPNSQAA